MSWQTEVFGLMKAREGFLYEKAGEPDGTPATEQTDVVLSGWAVRLAKTREDVPEEADAAWVFVETHYGYTGWMRRQELAPLSRQALKARQQEGALYRLGGRCVDLHEEPRVQGRILDTLVRGSFVERLKENETGDWSLIRSASGLEGWLPAQNLLPRRDSDGYLLAEGQTPSWLSRWADEVLGRTDHEALRASVVESALAFLGTQYRWGGKSPEGIDCSGLASVSWMENGVLIYRDALIVEGWPLREIKREELRPGDLIFFPGHVAIYLGDDHYVHATGYAKTPYVTINSLNPAHEVYRRDLAEQITACGTVF